MQTDTPVDPRDIPAADRHKTIAVATYVYSDGTTETASYKSFIDAKWHARQHVLSCGGEPTTGYTRTPAGKDATVYTAMDGKRAAVVATA